jgi:hypothetical protein
MPIVARPPWWMVLSVGCIAIGCGGDEPVNIRGGERLAWNQVASSVEQLNRYRFVLYVDGTPAQLLDPTCDPTAVSGAHPCSGGLPPLSSGQHTLELTTAEFGLESERSGPLVVVVTGAPTQMIPGGNSSPESESAAFETGSSICADTRVNECYTADLMVGELQSIGAVSVVEDGRLFLIENGERVRVVSRRTLLAEPAFDRERETDRLIAVRIGSDFPRTRWVHLAWIEEPQSGNRTLTIARYRELGDRFGEGAVVLSGLSLPSMGDPQVVWDATGRIYVAVPAEPGQRSGREVYEGLILRFDPDGTIPWQSGQVSPELAPGHAFPIAITSDDMTGRLWLSGRSEDGRADVGWLAWSSPSPGPQPLPGSGGAGGADAAVVSMAVGRPNERNPLGQLFLVDANGRLSLATLTREGLSRRSWLDLGMTSLVGVAAGRQGDVYVIARRNEGSAASFDVVRLAPR